MTIFIDDKPVQVISQKKFSKHQQMEDFDQVIDARLEALKPQNLLGRVIVLNATNLTIDKFFSFTLESKLSERKAVTYQAITFVVDNKKSVKNQIQSYYKIVKAAGGIIFNSDNKILLIHRLGKWDLPKGKCDDGENSKQTAIREVQEECNIKATLGEKICTTWHTYSLNGSKILKRTKWYHMDCLDDSKMEPQHEENIDELRWMDEREVQQALLNSYSSIRHVFTCLKNSR